MQIDIAEGLTKMRSHWHWRPGWAVGRRMYTFHLTMDGVGFTDEVTHAELDEVAEIVFETWVAAGSKKLLFDRPTRCGGRPLPGAGRQR